MSKVKASSLKSSSATFAFGDAGAGKTTEIIAGLPKDVKNVLHIALDNVGSILRTPAAKEFTVVTAPDWKTLMQDAILPVRSGAEKYDAIIVDGIDIALSMALESIAPTIVTQSDWASAGNMLRNMILGFKDQAAYVGFTANVKRTDEGDEAIALNRNTLYLLLPHAENKHFCYTSPISEEDKIVGVNYHVERRAALAVRFVRSY
jgi:hypothetical protein